MSEMLASEAKAKSAALIADKGTARSTAKAAQVKGPARAAKEERREGEMTELEEEFVEFREPSVKLLSESKLKHVFLFKTALLFLFFLLASSAPLAFAYLFKRDAKMYFHFLGERLATPLSAAAAAALLLFSGFGAKHLRPAAPLLFLLALAASALFTFCLYNFFEILFQERFVFLGIYVIIAMLNFVASAAGWAVSISILKANYLPLFCFTIMTACNFALSYAFLVNFDSALLRLVPVAALFAAAALANLYLAFEGRQLTESRAQNFLENDYFVAFFSLWVDWFSFFWTADAMEPAKEANKVVNMV